LLLLIREHQRARCQAEIPLTAPSEIVEPLLLIEGRKPHWHVAASIALSTNAQASYTLAKGVGDAQIKELIKSHLTKFPGAGRTDIDRLALPLLGSGLNDKQKKDKITNILSSMKNRDRSIKVEGRGPAAKWHMSDACL
jgi:ATP-dependent DNA helicase RecG